MAKLPLNPDQEAAVGDMVEFLAGGGSFFLLKGFAGTGKTFCIDRLKDRVRGRFIFTAPTNKATKVLRDTMRADDYKPECRTIYSLLGLRMEANGEIKELVAPEEEIDLSQFRAVIVDEASMINSQLMGHIRTASAQFGLPFIFMGDPAQLPPVKEFKSPVWEIENFAELTKVMRHDNQILELATRIRGVVDHPAPNAKLESNNADGEGVWRVKEIEFEGLIRERARLGRFSKANTDKAIAWRNVTVDRLNALVRREIFADASSTPWLPEDRIIVTEPAKDLDGEICATTDDEGVIQRVEVEYHPLDESMKVFRLSVALDDNSVIVLRPLHPDSFRDFQMKSEDLVAAAKMDRRKWKHFWEFKEMFHSVRHGYAITAHRAQGSTYETAFVDFRDILLNRNRQEAFRCLYVACTRPKKQLILG